MTVQHYSVNQQSIQTFLTWVEANQIAIPEIQRPFVWSATKVRDFIDSLYRGYPVGYLIAWQNPNVRLKDGSQSAGKRILIDGQQRITALVAALKGKPVLDKNFREKRITIAFHPNEERFEVTNPAIQRDKGWIPDITSVFASGAKMRGIVDKYCADNQGEDNSGPDIGVIDDRLERLKGILNNLLGIIDLNAELDVETVAEIFVRVNSEGVPLNEADFAMSKMAANEQYDGHQLRKCIDYFCHLAVAPEAYSELSQDVDFAATDYFRRMEWLKNEKEDLYDPTYTDMLRVAFTTKFKRGRLNDLVALLSGRNFETRSYEESIAEESFSSLKDGLLSFMNETNFKRFLMILRSAGFMDSSQIRSQNTVNFAYILYLTLREKGVTQVLIEKLVRRWFVMSMLTGRYTSQLEGNFGLDIANIDTQGAEQSLNVIEWAELSESFWEFGLPQRMITSAASSRYFNVFLASQIHSNDKGFLSKDITIPTLIDGLSDVHHVFPRNYLKKFEFKASRYNQIANYVVMQSEINIAISDDPPATYFSALWDQCNGGEARYGAITDANELQENLAAHCIPDGMEQSSADCYDTFLEKRRALMALKIRDYYRRL